MSKRPQQARKRSAVVAEGLRRTVTSVPTNTNRSNSLVDLSKTGALPNGKISPIRRDRRNPVSGERAFSPWGSIPVVQNKNCIGIDFQRHMPCAGRCFKNEKARIGFPIPGCGQNGTFQENMIFTVTCTAEQRRKWICPMIVGCLVPEIPDVSIDNLMDQCGLDCLRHGLDPGNQLPPGRCAPVAACTLFTRLQPIGLGLHPRPCHRPAPRENRT